MVPGPVQRVLLRPHPVRDYLAMTIGIVITAFGLNAFLVPNELAAGGASGLAIIGYALAQRAGFNLPVGLQTLAMNAILMIFVFRAGGFRYAAKTVFGIVGLAVAIDLTAPFIGNLASHDLMLASIWGGVVTGVGLGIVFKVGGNTGGTDILAQLIAPKTSLGIGQIMLIVDAVVLLIAAVVLGPELALYAAISIAIMSWIIDLVIEGFAFEKAVFIISNEYEAIGHVVTHELGRGATLIEASGVWTKERRPMLLIVLTRKEIGTLKTVVARLDPRALVIISNVHEAIGEGFKEIGVE